MRLPTVREPGRVGVTPGVGGKTATGWGNTSHWLAGSRAMPYGADCHGPMSGTVTGITGAFKTAVPQVLYPSGPVAPPGRLAKKGA